MELTPYLRRCINPSVAAAFIVGWLACVSMQVRAVEYFDPKDFQDPVMDAQQDIQRGQFRIWGILKNDRMRYPGLKADELDWLKQRNVEIEPKNHWAKYDKTPLPFDQALTMERYVARYNQSVLQWSRGNLPPN